MNTIFPGYYYSVTLEPKLLEKAIVIFDFNIFLELFKLPENESIILIDYIENAKLNLWMPYCMASQYHLRLNETIEQEISLYNHCRKKLAETRSFLDLPLCSISSEDISIFDDIICKIGIQLDSAMNKLKDHLKSTSSIRNRIAMMYSHCVGLASQDPHPYKDGISKDDNQATDVDKRTSYNGATIDSNSSAFPTYEKIAFNSFVDRAKELKQNVILVLSPSQQCLFMDNNGCVKQKLQNYFINCTNGQVLFCYSFGSFLKEIERCKKMSFPKGLSESINTLSRQFTQECKYLGENWFERT